MTEQALSALLEIQVDTFHPTAKPAHILTPSVTARGIVNITAIAAVEAAG